MRTVYSLEIYEPDDIGCVAGYYESNTPFHPFSIGDSIHGNSLNLSERKFSVRVKDVQHIFWEIKDSHLTQKVCIFTELQK